MTLDQKPERDDELMAEVYGALRHDFVYLINTGKKRTALLDRLKALVDYFDVQMGCPDPATGPEIKIQ